MARPRSKAPFRPRKRTAATADAIYKALRLLMSRAGACACAGISYDTFRRWLDDDDKFAAGVERAERDGERRHVENINEDALVHPVKVTKTKRYKRDGVLVTEKEVTERFERNSAASFKLLAKKFPSEYGERIDVTSGNAPIAGVNLAVLSQSDLDSLENILTKAAEPGPGEGGAGSQESS